MPLIVPAIICGFYLGGPGLGLAVGATAAFSVILLAVDDPPRPAIVPPVALDGRVRLLLLVDGAVGAAAVDTAAATVAVAGGSVEVLAVVPLRQGLVGRWISDTEKGRRLAEGRLAMVVSAFERAGVRVSGVLGDEDPVQAVDDALRSYPATVVALLATGSTEAADILKARLTVPLVRLRTKGRPARALRPWGERAPAPRPPGAAEP
ncbi:MAG: hypothetical protein JST59_11090 [Actinobacteria bacterium]|nr:hypothetical protein [Actinomycetota bacterium]